MIRTIYTTVYAIVREIKRSEHNDSVAVEFMFYLTSDVVNLVDDFLVVAFKKKSCFSVRDALTFTSLLKYRFYKFNIIAVFAGISHRFANLGIADEFLCYL
jgi:hypothetical protein